MQLQLPAFQYSSPAADPPAAAPTLDNSLLIHL